MPGTGAAPLSEVYVASWCSLFCCTVCRHSDLVNTIFGSGWSPSHGTSQSSPPLPPRVASNQQLLLIHYVVRSQRPRTPAFGGRCHICGTLQVHNTRTQSQIGPVENFLHSFARTHPHQRIFVGAFMFHVSHIYF